MTSPQIPREDITAAVAARRELGEDYDAAFVETIVERVNQTIDARLGAEPDAERTRREAAEAKAERTVTIAVAAASLFVAIPLTAIAGNTAGFPAILVVWLGIVMVNLAVALRSRAALTHRPRPRRVVYRPTVPAAGVRSVTALR